MRRTQERLKALEEEQKRIQVSELNLPLCLEFLTQEIESCRKELSGDCGGDDKVRDETMTETVGGQSDVQKQKESPSQPQKKLKRVRTSEFGGSSDGKDSESFSLFGSKIIIHGDDKDRGETITETVGGQSEFENQKQSQSLSPSPSLSLSLSLSPSPSQPQSEANKKQRLDWTLELHNKFYSLMQQLGRSDVATPKEIRAYYLKRQQQGSPSGREN